MQSRVFTYHERRSLADLIDVRLAMRLERKGNQFNQGRARQLAIFAHEHIGIEINQFGVYDKEGLQLLFEFLEPLAGEFRNGVALDVGANIGNHALFFARFFRRVYAFEPHPASYYLLQFNSRLVENIEPCNFGLADESATLNLFENAGNMGASSMKRPQGVATSVDVPVKRLDDVDLPLDGLCFMKLDVEGFEANVLRGALKVLREQQPVVVFEQHEKEFNGRETESITILRELGYVICWPESRYQGMGVLRRRLHRATNLLLGRAEDYDVVVGDDVPARTYSMLIAVPPRFQERLRVR